MKLNCPVLTSTTSSMPEVGAQAAIYSEPDDMDSIIENIEKLAEDNKLIDKLKSDGQIRAGQFTWKASAQKHMKIYETLK